MIKEHCLEGVDEVFGMHNMPDFPEGDIRVQAGPVMSGISEVIIKITGKGGHGSMPHKVQDTITAGAHVLIALNQIKAREVDNKEQFVFTICSFNSGHTFNVFPDDAYLKGTVRAYKIELLDFIQERIKHIATKTAEALNCQAEVTFQNYYPPIINHQK